MAGWIGVDLDGTLAEYHGWESMTYIGKPIPLMMGRVKAWIAQGIEVKIFTARASYEPSITAIKAWCVEQGLPELEVTNVKDMHLWQLWDDRAVSVQHNTGMAFGWREDEHYDITYKNARGM